MLALRKILKYTLETENYVGHVSDILCLTQHGFIVVASALPRILVTILNSSKLPLVC